MEKTCPISSNPNVSTTSWDPICWCSGAKCTFLEFDSSPSLCLLFPPSVSLSTHCVCEGLSRRLGCPTQGPLDYPILLLFETACTHAHLAHLVHTHDTYTPRSLSHTPRSHVQTHSPVHTAHAKHTAQWHTRRISFSELPSLKVYVYDLPPEFNTDQVKSNPQCL